MRLVFMGSAAFAVPILRRLADAHELAAVFARPPALAGRGMKLRPVPVAEAAQEMGLRLETPRDWRAPDAGAALAACRAELAVVAAYGLLLPPAILGAPQLGCLNVHASLLPRWRGAAPIARALAAGDAQTGISLMQMTEGLDEGDVFCQRALAIAPEDTSGRLAARLADLAAGLLLEFLAEAARSGLPQPVRQDGARASYAPKIAKAERQLDWTRSADALARHVRALSPDPAAWFAWRGERVKVLFASAEPAGARAPPGTVLDDRAAIACGAGALRLLCVQRAGRAPMATAAFLRGARFARGQRLTRL